MRKIIAAAVLTLAAAPAFASSKPAPDTRYGIVHTYCMGADEPGTQPGNGCRAFLASEGKTITLNGNFTRIAKFNGKMVVVKGTEECLNGGASCAFAVSSIKAAAAQPLQPLTGSGSATARESKTTGGTAVSSSAKSGDVGTTR